MASRLREDGIVAVDVPAKLADPLRASRPAATIPDPLLALLERSGTRFAGGHPVGLGAAQLR